MRDITESLRRLIVLCSFCNGSYLDSTLVGGANCTHVALKIAGEIYPGVVIPLMNHAASFIQPAGTAQPG